MNASGPRQEDAHRSSQQGNIASEQLCSTHHDQQQSKGQAVESCKKGTLVRERNEWRGRFGQGTGGWKRDRGKHILMCSCGVRGECCHRQFTGTELLISCTNDNGLPGKLHMVFCGRSPVAWCEQVQLLHITQTKGPMYHVRNGYATHMSCIASNS